MTLVRIPNAVSAFSSNFISTSMVVPGKAGITCLSVYVKLVHGELDRSESPVSEVSPRGNACTNVCHRYHLMHRRAVLEHTAAECVE